MTRIAGHSDGSRGTHRQEKLFTARMGTALPTLINRALARAGIDDVEQDPWNPTPARVADAVQHVLAERVLPELGDDARTDVSVLPMAVRYLADAAAGRQFDIVGASSALGASDTGNETDK
jgi:hypothetical protein